MIRQPSLVNSHRGEDGAALVIALVVMLAMGLVVAAVVTYSATSTAGVKGYRILRQERYAGDAVLKSNIGYAANNYQTGRDPALNLNSPSCVTYLPTNIGTNQAARVKSSCVADSGGYSGKPADVGLQMPEALTLLSKRTSEPGPYNVQACSGWWDSFLGLFNNDNNINVDQSRGQAPERGAWFRPRNGLGTLGAPCGSQRGRTYTNFIVQGDVKAASNILVQNGSLTAVGGTIQARDPGNCSGVTCNAVANRSGLDFPLDYLNGTAGDTDPGINPSSGNGNIGKTAMPFMPVGFGADGSPYAGSITAVQRTTAYNYTTGAADSSPTTNCTGASATIVFLPGWYTDANVLNKYTTSASCKDITFWFAPDPGPDGKLLTADDRTGSFYFDFRGTTVANSCNGTGSSKTRWCIGGSPDQNARIVAGTPDGWTPQGSYTGSPGGTDPRARQAVSITTANTIDKDLSQSWSSAGAANTIDGSAAFYHATVCFIFCFSSDRAIRVRDLQPKVTGPAIDEGSGIPNGRIYLSVAYGVVNSQNADPAQAVIQAVSPSSGRKNCGTYTLYGNASAPAPFNNKNNANFSSGLHTYKFTDAQAQQLAAACGSVDLINGLEIKVQVTGNGLNINGGATNWYFDGVKVNYDSFPGANFPNPTNVGTGSDAVAAKSDCDETKPGGQFVFGGDSHVYVADGSMEICAGPFTPNPNVSGDTAENHESIGIWAMPSLAEVNPTGTNITRGGDASSLDNTSNITAIDNNVMTINYDACNFACSDRDAWARFLMGAYTPPPGYWIQRITARVSYNPKNSCLGFLGCPGNNAQLETPSCGRADMPKHGDFISQVADFRTDLVMYDDGSTGNGSRNCIGASNSSLPQGFVTWHARAGCFLGICGGPYHDTLDGVGYQISLRPANTIKLLPQTGCIVNHPNYNEGSDQPDCALVRADTSDFNDNFHLPWATAEGKWTGRLSVKGTIYAPSSAIEVDDTDVAYPLATRGAVLRTLRVTGFGARDGYTGAAIGNTVDRTPQPREATFTACVQTVSAEGSPCASGDHILTRARVRFDIDSSWPVVAERARLPRIVWWSLGK